MSNHVSTRSLDDLDVDRQRLTGELVEDLHRVFEQAADGTTEHSSFQAAEQTLTDLLDLARTVAAQVSSEVAAVGELFPAAEGPYNHISRCVCGSKYWSEGRCIDCADRYNPEEFWPFGRRKQT